MTTLRVDVDTSRRDSFGFAQLVLSEVGTEMAHVVETGLDALSDRCGLGSSLEVDLVVVASTCYVVDKTVARKSTPDGWTRELSVAIPVSDPKLWNRVRMKLQRFLAFLTGDIWSFSFYERGADFYRRRLRKRTRRLKRRPIPFTSVCLFSGGLDSLCGAINVLEGARHETVLLLGHYDSPGPRRTQEELFGAVRAEYMDRVELVQVRVSHSDPSAPGVPVSSAESTQRSRSFVFLALGVYAAASRNRTRGFYAPENGFIAANVPLTPARTGSCSTRTMHPHFLRLVGEMLRSLGISVRIQNPLQRMTKGEVLSTCLNQSLLRASAQLSVSCGHASRRKHWPRIGSKNCGYCVPCIIRRASMHSIGLDDGLEYGFDVCSNELTIDDSRDSANDLRAVAAFVASKHSPADIARALLAHGPTVDAPMWVRVVQMGIEELKSLFHDKGSIDLKAHMGIIA